MAGMTKIGAFALTEPEGGSDVAGGMRTTARHEGGGTFRSSEAENGGE